jgi:putative permease
MQTQSPATLYRVLTKVIAYAVGMVILLWFFYEAVSALLLLLFAMVLAIVINAPVVWLERKGLRRGWACAAVFITILLVLGLLTWLIVPKISEQVRALIQHLPSYADQLARNVSSWFEYDPKLSQQIREEGMELSQWLPSIPQTLMQIGNYSLSVLSALIIFIFFVSMVVYAVSNPRPLLEIYFTLFRPDRRNKAQKALSDASGMLIGWIRSDLIGGGIEGVLTTIFLSYMNVPGAWVWGALAFVAKLIPRIGFYIMLVPPTLVALSISPLTALWVAIFFIVMDEIMADFVLPRLRSSTMRIHPVSMIFIFLAMGSAFGFIGAIMSAPIVAIIKAYYEAFWAQDARADKSLDERIDSIIYRQEKS